MSGSNLICTVTAVLETGMVPMKEPVTELCVDTPAGLVRVRAECGGGKCRRVSFRNVSSFVMHSQKPVDVAGFGTITVDVAYGGMIYDRRCGSPRLSPRPGRGAGLGGRGRTHQARRRRTVAVGSSAEPRNSYHQPNPVRRTADGWKTASRRRRTQWWCPQGASTGVPAGRAVPRGSH